MSHFGRPSAGSTQPTHGPPIAATRAPWPSPMLVHRHPAPRVAALRQRPQGMQVVRQDHLGLEREGMPIAHALNRALGGADGAETSEHPLFQDWMGRGGGSAPRGHDPNAGEAMPPPTQPARSGSCPGQKRNRLPRSLSLGDPVEQHPVLGHHSKAATIARQCQPIGRQSAHICALQDLAAQRVPDAKAAATSLVRADGAD
jgi:hypothetical protein